MNRRRFVQQSVIGGGVLLGGAGLLFARRSYAREAVASKMLDDALPSLTASSNKALYHLAGRARDEMKRYFHGKCLNVEGFVTHICSNDFMERVSRCDTTDEKEACFLQAFCSRIATDAEILDRVEMIAAEIGGELDDEWTTYCAELSLKWNARIRGYGSPLTADELTTRLTGLIRDDSGQAARSAMSDSQRPAVGDTIGKIGESAVLLLPLVRLGKIGLLIGIPVFLMLAAKHVWDYFIARLDDRRGEFQTAISSRLALLGNRVGSEFEREVHHRITDLHTWQEQSIRSTAIHLAQERVSLI